MVSDGRVMTRSGPPPRQTDIAVVGGGIVGLATARELIGREPDARICLLEAEDHLAAHQTSHTSGVIHAGVYYEPGSLRARLCVEGADELNRYCGQRGIPHPATGKLIVATDETELERLDELERRGRANGVRGLCRIPAGRIAEIEPAARGLGALHSPATGVVDFARVASGFAADFEAGGGTIHLGAPVRVAGPDPSKGGSHVRSGRASREPSGRASHEPSSRASHEPSGDLRGRGVTLGTPGGVVRAARAVFCAGLQSDRLARAAGGSASPRIVPIRGGYLKVRPGKEDLVRGNIYPVPDPALPFLGAHLTRTMDGSLLIGPTALIVGARDAYRISRLNPRDLAETLAWPGTWRLMRRAWRAGLREIRHAVDTQALVSEATRMVPGLTMRDVEPGPCGIRAQALGRDGRLVDDFLVEQIGDGIHVRNAPSPAATSSMALARLIADRTLAA